MSYEPLLLNRLVERAGRDIYRGHMPGHKGKPRLPMEAERLDFTELCDTGNLYDMDDNIIREAERAVADALSVNECVYCAGGSTLLIQGAIAALAENIGHPPRILAARDAHRSFFAAMTLVGGEVEFLYPFYSEEGIALGISEEELRHTLRYHHFDAVYITAPNYYGAMGSLDGVLCACNDMNVPLIVDAAHAAHLATLGLFGSDERGNTIFRHGSDLIAIFSAHKTLEAMGGAAFSLSTGGVFNKDSMLRGMHLFGTTSPSYAILASLDGALAHALSPLGQAEYLRNLRRIQTLRNDLLSIYGIRQPTFIPQYDTLRERLRNERRYLTCYDPYRFVFAFENVPASTGAQWLEQYFGVVCEMFDEYWLVFIITSADRKADFERMQLAIKMCSLLMPMGGPDGEFYDPTYNFPKPPRAQIVMTPREAYFAPTEKVVLCSAEGRVAADFIAPYPPGLPVVAPGEKISSAALSFLRRKCYNMNETIRVVK